VSVIVLNKDADRDLALTLDFGAGKTGAIATETLRAPALNSREAHIVRTGVAARLKDGKHAVTVPRASGLRVTVG
jgi:dUTPase